MKSAIRKSEIRESKAFVINYLDDPFFDTNWHFHSEYQLFVVLEGRGTRFIGDNIAHFQEGEVVFIAPNMPHLWRNDDAFFNKNSQLRAQGIVIYFPNNLFGDCLLNKDEMLGIKQLLERSNRGIEFQGQTGKKIANMMKDLLYLPGLEGIIQLLSILNVLSESTEYQYISSLGYTNNVKEGEKDRMNEVYTFIMQNYRKNILLEEVAEIASMSPTSFSRFFKVRTNKSFTSFLTELRIGYACKLLLEDDNTIAQICYESGCNTLSNFNKQFKEVTHKTPYAYKKEYLKAI
ncbi:AraC family transcriptional regulator [Adhaeribacter pallidiroseus]|uniref:Putative HTH-type transcriptional regulator n=1 Tax=Adhaeribacter pallidiroseus TaxID=2072847 RepID=A0A369QFF6_9BACT|nr:AraC family transcriptional regulator [Adhaeribacter pallidiroseus]RDC61956.1 putative HTH-type transcriptional regulator [Adhaeribacter pallidiroseus]